MSLDVTNTWYRAEVVPQTQKDLVRKLAAFHGVGADSMGTRGNTSHTSGYHRSRNWVLKVSARKASDYSVQLAVDKQGDPNWTCAVDGTPGSWGTPENRRRMIVATGNLINAAKAHDPRLAAVREIAGTLDGKHVVTWDCSRNAFKDPFDSSHLDHYHVSLYRGMAANDHTGIFEVIAGIGSSATGANNQEADKMLDLIQWTGSAAVFITDGITARLLTPNGLTSEQGLYDAGVRRLRQRAVVTVDDRSVIGLIEGRCPKEFADQAKPGASVVSS